MKRFCLHYIRNSVSNYCLIYLVVSAALALRLLLFLFFSFLFVVVAFVTPHLVSRCVRHTYERIVDKIDNCLTRLKNN